MNKKLDKDAICLKITKKTSKRLRNYCFNKRFRLCDFIEKAVNDKLDWEEALAKKGKK